MKANIYSNMGGWYRLLFFFLFTIGGFFVTITAITALVGIMGVENATTSTFFLKISQIIQAIGLFILPPVCYSKLFYGDSLSFLKLNSNLPIKAILITIALVFVVQPIIQIASYYNQQMILPESLLALEQWMQAKEDSVKKVLEIFLTDKSLMSYVSNVFVIAIVAGVAEELFFRGGIQQIFYKITKNKHAAIWITAIIFSTIHFQFYGFFPRMIAGAMLGYLFVWSQNLWLPIIAHTIHNAFNLIVAQTYYNTPQYEKLEYMGIENHQWLALLSLLVLAGVVFMIKRKKILLAQ